MPGVLDYLKLGLLGPTAGNLAATNPTQGPVPGIAGPTQAPQQQAQPSTPIPEQSGVASSGTSDPAAAQGNDKERSRLMEVLLRLGVPLGAAIVGTANEDYAGSAGALAQGYNQGVEYGDTLNKQKRKEEADMQDDDVAIINPETGEKQIIKIPAGARIMRKGGKPLTKAEFDFGEDGTATFGGKPMTPGGAAESAMKKTAKYKRSDIEYTAKQRGISTKEVLSQLGGSEEDVE